MRRCFWPLMVFLCGCFGPTGDNNLRLVLQLKDPHWVGTGCADGVADVIRQRLDYYGVSGSNISITTEANRIVVFVEGLVDPDRAERLITTSGSIGFWETYENAEVYPYLSSVNKLLANLEEAERQANGMEKEELEPERPKLLEKFGSDTSSGDAEMEMAFRDMEINNPLFAKLSPAGSTQGLFAGPVIGYAAARDTAKINAYFAMEEVKALLPGNLKLAWTNKPIDMKDTSAVHQLIAIKVLGNGQLPALDGSSITDADPYVGTDNKQPEVSMQMDDEGARSWQLLTRNNVGRSIAITVNEYVYSFPTVQGEIMGGRSSITGNFTQEEAQDLANVLSSKAHPCGVVVLEKQVSQRE